MDRIDFDKDSAIITMNFHLFLTNATLFLTLHINLRATWHFELQMHNRKMRCVLGRQISPLVFHDS